MKNKLYQIFAEHYEILLQDIAAAMVNRKRSAVKRCSYVLETVMDLFSEIFNISVKEAHKVLLDIAFPDEDKENAIFELHENNVDVLFCKFYHTQSDLFGTDKDSEATVSACEIITMFAELHSLSYDKAAKWLNDEKDGVKV